MIIIFDSHKAVFPDFPARTQYFKSGYYSRAICVKIYLGFQVVWNNAGSCRFQSCRKAFSGSYKVCKKMFAGVFYESITRCPSHERLLLVVTVLPGVAHGSGC